MFWKAFLSFRKFLEAHHRLSHGLVQTDLQRPSHHKSTSGVSNEKVMYDTRGLLRGQEVSEMKMKVKSLSRVRLCATPRTVARQAPLSMGFSKQDYWSGLPCSPPGDLPDPGTEPVSLTSPASAGRFFTNTIW